MNNNARIAALEDRVSRLESLLQPKTRVSIVHDSSEAYEGPRGGIRLLMDKGFFNEKRPLGAVRAAFAENGYHYSRQSVHEALAFLSKPTGPLVALKEGGVKIYVNRK